MSFGQVVFKILIFEEVIPLFPYADSESDLIFKLLCTVFSDTHP